MGPQGIRKRAAMEGRDRVGRPSSAAAEMAELIDSIG
jgi:hypothetical protein